MAVPAYGCVVGGGTVTYGGSSWRHLPYEFSEATHEATIAGTGMADWPVTYEELEPYYTKAEWEMGISGLRVDSPFFAPMTKDYPVPPLPLKSFGRAVQDGGRQARIDRRSQCRRDYQPAYQGRSGVRQLAGCVRATDARSEPDPARPSPCFRLPRRPADAKFESTATSARSRSTTTAA